MILVDFNRWTHIRIRFWLVGFFFFFFFFFFFCFFSLRIRLGWACWVFS